VGLRASGCFRREAHPAGSYRTIKGILIAGTEAPDQPGGGTGPAGWAAAVPAFLHGPETLFEPSDDRGLALVLGLPTHQLIGEAR